MPVEEALEKLREADHYLLEVGVIEAEFERLQRVIADQALTIGALKDELSRTKP